MLTENIRKIVKEMVKYCLNCGAGNSDDALWCSSCNSKLVDNYQINQEISGEDFKKKILERQDIYKSYDDYENKAIKRFTISFLIIIVFVGVFVYFSVIKGSDFNWINCQFNEDFWFEEDKIITDDGWTITMDRIQDYKLEGIVLALNTYNRGDSPYDPCNIFCPIDLFVGVDDVMANPENYDYSIRSFSNRKVCWYMTYDNVEDYYYFKSRTGNNHLIPHNEEVLNMMQNISVNDRILIEGGLINLYGERGDETFYRPTDTHIGNYACEAILVDNLIIK